MVVGERRRGMKLSVAITPDLVRLICGWQGHARVIEPESLRDAVKEAGRRLAAA
jgi:predicted DNA-binding transcriptional regulator YafY